MVASWRPDIAMQVAFNAGPNDPNAVPIWSDLTSRFRKASRVQRGRQYELDQSQGNQPQLTFFDQDEALNPANPLSPFAPNVLPYRHILWQAQWPNTTVGNLLNAGYGANPSLRTVAGYDPGFESYAPGATVPWISAVGGTTPTVTSTGPHSGSRALAYSIPAGSAPQGISLVVPCIPGRQYTTSAWISQGAANTQQIGVTDQDLAVETFNRTVSNGWGTADVGGNWAVAGGSNADFSVGAGTAYQSNGTVSVPRTSTIGSGIADVAVTARATIPVVAAGGPIKARVVLRRVDASNYYMLEAAFNTDNTVGLLIWKTVAGTATQLANVNVPFSYAAGTTLWLRFTATGTSLSGQCWLDGSAPAFGATATATDTSLTAGAVGVESVLHSLVSNTLPVAIAWTRFTAVGTAAGTSTSLVASYQRLSVTFTASQPTHVVQVATSGTVVSSAATVDDLQHEQAASPSPFTTTGPTIYGIFRGYVERWPSQWGHMGFLGEANVTCVDAFGPQNLIKLWTEFRNSVLAKKPAYYWPLNEPSAAVAFAEASGNNGPSLIVWNSPQTIPTAPAPGTSTNMPGDPSGNGVQFTQGAVNPGGSDVGAMLGAGPVFRRPAVAFPASATGSNWGCTLVAWVQLTYPFGGGSTAGFIVKAATFQPNNTAQVSPGSIIANSDGSLDMTFYGPGFANVPGGAPHAVDDGRPHLIVATATQAPGGGNTVLTIYVDGVQYNTATYSTISLGLINQPVQNVMVGGRNDGTYSNQFVGGTIAHVALYNRALSTSEITDLWNASKGYLGESTGARLSRYMGYSWPGQTVIDTGQSAMGVSDTAAGTALLAAAQAIATTENGNYWVDDLGNSTFAARTRRYLAITSLYTFGERTDLGEIPYEGDIGFDFDLTLVYNDIEIDNANGVIAVAKDPASQLAYFPRGYQRSINVKDNNEAVDAATYLLNAHKQPHLRVQTVVLDPAKTTNWGVVLALEVGQRVTVKRRASAANGGAGLTIQGDFFVENVAIEQVDMGAGVWTVRLYLSPVDVTQVGILDNGTFGRLATGGAQLNASITSAATTAVVNLTGGDLFTPTGVPFQATIDSEIVTVTAVPSAVVDGFNRTVSNGWGNADAGGAWTISQDGGTTADYAVAPSAGSMSNGATSQRHRILGGAAIGDADVYVTTSVPALATGAPIESAVLARYADPNNLYYGGVQFNTDGSVTGLIVKRVAGAQTTITSATIPFLTYTAGAPLRMRFTVKGSSLSLKVWPAGGPEPQAYQVTATDSAITAAGQVGLTTVANGGNTNVPVAVKYSNFVSNSTPQTLTITRPTDGTAAAHNIGAPVQTYRPFVLAY